ncbi:ER lumen protein-retaining receptor [Capsicum annuum]|nr:ER lumen protein-retaining receptor [Capsicum annuum]
MLRGCASFTFYCSYPQGKESRFIGDLITLEWKGSLGVNASCDQEVGGSGFGNGLMQKCKVRLCTTDPCGQALPRILHIAGALVHRASLFFCISLKTQELYALVFITRYLDIFTDFISLYNTTMKLVFLGSSLSIVWYMKHHKIVRRSYDKDQDTFRHVLLVVPCLILALVIHEKFTFKEVMWTFSIFLEAVAILPQLVLLQRTRNIDNLTGQYILLLGAYRSLYILNWVYRYFTEPHFVHWITWISGLVQTLLYADFFYYYFQRIFKKAHHDRSKVSSNPPKKLLLLVQTNDDVFEFRDLENPQIAMVKRKFPLKRFQHAPAVCSCSGLVLLKSNTAYKSYALWNPYTNEYGIYECPYVKPYSCTTPHACGFCKVILICRTFYAVGYVSKSDWRMGTSVHVQELNESYSQECCQGINVEGRVFWSMEWKINNLVSRESKIIYFELKELPKPDFVGENDKLYRLTSLKGCVGLYGGNIIGSKTFDVWIMEQDELAISFVLGVSKGQSDKHWGTGGWNDEVKRKMETKKVVYAKLVESKDDEENLDAALEGKGWDSKLYRLSKAKERRAHDPDHVKCIKGEDYKVLVEDDLIRKRSQSYFYRLLNCEEAKVSCWMTWKTQRCLAIMVITGVSRLRRSRGLFIRCVE